MPKLPEILITNWDRLQHFKDRDPIWIKLYRQLRHNRRWRHLSGDAAKLYIDLLLLAADEEPFGSISLSGEDLAWEVRLTNFDLLVLLTELGTSGLITISGYQDDIKLLSAGNQGDDDVISLARSREVEREVEVEKETTYDQPKKRDPSKLYVDVEEFKLFCRDFDVDLKAMDILLDR